MIRYRRSSDRKRCRPAIRRRYYHDHESLGSGGSIFAKLKLKGIDGRAPPEVEPAA